MSQGRQGIISYYRSTFYRNSSCVQLVVSHWLWAQGQALWLFYLILGTQNKGAQSEMNSLIQQMNKEASAVHWAPLATWALKTSKEIHPQGFLLPTPTIWALLSWRVHPDCSLIAGRKLAPFCQSDFKLWTLVRESHRVPTALPTSEKLCHIRLRHGPGNQPLWGHRLLAPFCDLGKLHHSSSFGHGVEESKSNLYLGGWENQKGLIFLK